MMFGYKHTFRVSWGLGQGVRGLGVRGASGHGTMNIGWNIMMCGCKHTFRVSWGLGQGVRGLGVRASGHGTMNIGWNIMMCGCHVAVETFLWQHPTTERYKHCPLQPTHNGAVISDTNPDRYKRPPCRLFLLRLKLQLDWEFSCEVRDAMVASKTASRFLRPLPTHCCWFGHAGIQEMECKESTKLWINQVNQTKKGFDEQNQRLLCSWEHLDFGSHSF